MKGKWRKVGVSIYLVPGVIAAAGAMGHEPIPSRYTYQEHILPIIEKKCSDCHRSGGIAPMSLLQYQEAISWANAIKRVVLEGIMPPWLPKEGVGEFSGSRSLSAEEIDMLVEWAAGGTPEGEASGETSEDLGISGWDLGEPDLVLQPNEDVVLAEDESESIRCVVIPSESEEDHWISAFQFEPGASTVVHDVTITLGETCSTGTRPVATWLPGDGAFLLPEGVAEKVPASASFALRIHYRKTWVDDGTEVRDRSKLGLYYAPEGEKHPVQSLRLQSEAYRFDHGARLIAFFPVPSSRTKGEPIQLVARFPDGEVNPLLEMDRFDPAWVSKYKPVRPVDLPPGTVLEAISATLWIDYRPNVQ